MNLRFLRTAALLAVSACAHAQTVEHITVDPAGASHAFPHFWEKMFGSGRANLSLREDYRHDLDTVGRATELQYVRFHAILDDENGVYDEDAQGRPTYNFSYVDQIYDGLLQHHVKPFVEISFMPRKLAAHLQPHPFWYKPLPSPPNNEEKWAALIRAFTQHLEQRYGASEVRSWYFEVWNEPNIDFWNGEPKQSTYFELYDVTSRAVKQVDEHVRVGGPATAQAAWVDAFIDHCVKNHVPFDFVSTHVYGNEDSVNVFGRKRDISRKDMVGASAKKVFDQVKASAAPNTPIIWSEYNATYMTQQEVTDSAFMGPWLANNIRLCDGLTSLMSYWDFSDVFEEQGVTKTPFYGGYGLVAERSIPKPAFNAFVLLHALGDRRIENASENALVTLRADGTPVIALWNYAEPGEAVADRSFKIETKGATYRRYRLQWVDPERGSSLAAWKKMSSPASPTMQQIAELQRSAELPPVVDEAIEKPIVLKKQSLAVIELY